MNKNNNQHEDCCPLFDPKLWDEKENNWQNKLFIKDSIPQFLHFPLPGTFARAVNRMWKKAQEADAAPEIKDFLLLAYDPSSWKSDLYMTVNKEVEGARNVRLSGTFISKVFDGPYDKIPQYIREMDRYLEGQMKLATKLYFYFTTCPKCAKKYGHNYIVAFAEV